MTLDPATLCGFVVVLIGANSSVDQIFGRWRGLGIAGSTTASFAFTLVTSALEWPVFLISTPQDIAHFPVS